MIGAIRRTILAHLRRTARYVGAWYLSAANEFLVIAGVALLVGQVVRVAIASDTEALTSFLHVGPPAALAGTVGAVRLLLSKASALRDVTTIDAHRVLMQGMHLDATALARFGDGLRIDDIFVYAIFALLIVVLVFEARIGKRERDGRRAGLGGFVRWALLGFIFTVFCGFGALALVYVRS
jgi:hypothetical protein